jgi:protein TonB
MHATLDRTAETGGNALFFTDLPDPAREQDLIRQADVERSSYGACRRPNWPAILLIALLHVGALIAMVKFDVIPLHKKAPDLIVINISEPPQPPIVQPPKPKTPPQPEKIVQQVVSPPPIVQPVAPPPPPVAVIPPPPKPVPVVAAAAAPAPVAVDNLDEKMIGGSPPRYPLESRRKKEQGTVELRLLIGTDGRVEQVSIAQSSGFDRLDQAALQAAKSWRWQPMIRNGQPVEVRGLLSIPFVLKG